MKKDILNKIKLNDRVCYCFNEVIENYWKETYIKIIIKMELKIY